MKKINKIAIVWESDTGGGVNSYLRYLLHSKDFLEKEITIFTNFQNLGAKPLMKDLAKLKNIKFIFFKSFFDGKRKNLFEKIIFYFLNPFFLLLTINLFSFSSCAQPIAALIFDNLRLKPISSCKYSYLCFSLAVVVKCLT